MFDLTIALPNSVAPPRPDLADPNVEVWRDLDGTLCACGFIRGTERWIQFPGLASFCFDLERQDVIAIPTASVHPDLINDVYTRCVLPLALQARGQEVLHASAIATPRGVVSFCGTSESGKSTIAYGLSRRGYPQWSDDAVAFDLGDPVVRAIPLPFRVRLRPPSAAYFHAADPGSLSSDAAPIPPSPREETTFHLPGDSPALALLCVLCQVQQEDSVPTVELTTLTPARAFKAVLGHAYCYSLSDQERKRRMVEAYLELTDRVPVVEICYQSGLGHLPSLLDAIERAIAELPTPGAARADACV